MERIRENQLAPQKYSPNLTQRQQRPRAMLLIVLTVLALRVLLDPFLPAPDRVDQLC